MTGRTLLMDFETRSAVDIGKCGSYRYIEDDSFRPLLLAYAFDDEPVKLVDFAQGEDWPREFLDVLRNPSVTKMAYNAAFERGVIGRTLGYTDPAEWLDVMHLAAQCGLPLGLDAVGKALGLGEEQAKMREGKALIRFFCTLRKPTKTNPKEWNDPEDAPERWQTFRDYCVRDVEAERTIFRMLERWMPDDRERAFWNLDQRINDRGVRIDRRLAERAVVMDERYKWELTEQAVALTGLENPKSVAQVKAWLSEQEGIDVPSLNKKVVADVVAQLQTEQAKSFMEIRKELSKSSTAKYAAMLRGLNSDDHARGCFQFYGTSTGRFAGRRIQFQNLSKNKCGGDELDGMRELVRNGHYTALRSIYGGVADCLSQLVRTAIIPEPGQKILVADFSAIEARVTAWLASEEWVLDAFRNGKDIYCETASRMFHVPVEKHGVNAELRQKGKVAVLGLGFSGGIGALKAFGADKTMSDEELQETVDLWRASNPNIVKLWKSLDASAKKCIADRVSVRSSVGHVRFDYEGGNLFMTLPSGRRLCYWGAELEDSRKFDGMKSITVMAVDQTTRKWRRQEIWRGILVENLVQATARDILREAMFSLTEKGFDIRATVHDECICTEQIGGKTVEEMCEAMCPHIPWAEGLPLRAEGYEGDYYFKD